MNRRELLRKSVPAIAIPMVALAGTSKADTKRTFEEEVQLVRDTVTEFMKTCTLIEREFVHVSGEHEYTEQRMVMSRSDKKKLKLILNEMKLFGGLYASQIFGATTILFSDSIDDGPRSPDAPAVEISVRS